MQTIREDGKPYHVILTPNDALECLLEVAGFSEAMAPYNFDYAAAINGLKRWIKSMKVDKKEVVSNG